MVQKDNNNIQARTNPIFLTAKMGVCLMAQAGIPDAATIVGSLGLEGNEPFQGLWDSDAILGNALVVEAKYRTMCRLIEEAGYQTCVDLPCGYTPKALRMTEKGMRFVGLDLPIVVQEIEPILRSLSAHPLRMAFHGVDATNYASLAGALRDVDGPLCITTEGMMMYFTDIEAEAVISNIRDLLEAYGGSWITPDPEFMLQFFGSFRSVFGERSLGKLTASGKTAQKQSNVQNLSNAFILDVKDIPGSRKKAEALLGKHGLKAEKVNLADHMPALSVYQKLTAEQIGRFEKAMQDCHYWVITLDGTHRRQEGCPVQIQRPFGMSYTVENGTFRLTLEGRLDSISAPEILMAWEKEKTASAIEEVTVEGSGLSYISSAGIRVLLDIQEECSRGMMLIGVNPSVAGILAQQGFTKTAEGRWKSEGSRSRSAGKETLGVSQ